LYINSINYFRAIAIIFIVFGHCLRVADFNYNSILGNTIFNLTLGGTSLFVFISGFLFHHIFYKNFEYKAFIIQKIKYVLFPYLILSTIPIVFLLSKTCKAYILSSSTFLLQYESLLSFPIVRHYLTGVDASYIGYWYIPFIMIVFALSPIFVRFIKLKLKTQILIALFLLTCSVFMHKGIDHNAFSIFQNVFFFTPVYLIGIMASEKRDLIYSKLNGKEFYIFSIVIILAIIQVYSGKLGNYHKDPFTLGGIDLMYIQKMVLCLFFMVYLNRFENHKFKLLEIIAANSFGIYFIHGIVIWAIGTIKNKLGISFTSNSFIIYVLMTTLVFFLSLITTLIVKRTLPKYSRYLVGS
jgi:surface polysaccharide O-acyltransferase-like enzyme